MHTIIIKSAKTGELKEFQLTKAGAYGILNAALENAYDWSIDSARMRIERDGNTPTKEAYLYAVSKTVNWFLCSVRGIGREFKDILNFVANEIRAKIMVEDSYSSVYNTAIDFGREMFANIISLPFGNYFKEDTFKLNYTIYPSSFRRFVRRCESCGQLYFDQDCLERELDIGEIAKITRGDIGLFGLCRDCFLEENDYTQCDYCGLLRESDEMYFIENTQLFCCQDFLEYGCFHQCDNCGDWIDTDEDGNYLYTDDDRFFCCESCAERYGYHYSESRECWTEEYDDEDDESNDYIGDYHSHYYKPIKLSDEKTTKHPLYIGRELEVDGQDRCEFNGNFYEGLYDLLTNEEGNKTCFFERDGSLDGGFEIITNPMTEKAFFTMDWSKALDKLAENGWKSHNTTTCGLHFHYSSWYLGYTEAEKLRSARKIAYFFQKNWEELVKFSRRKEFGYCTPYSFDIDKNTPYRALAGSRYYAVNLTNLGSNRKDTIEIRICRGTLKNETMLASADFFLHIVRNAKKISWKNIDNLSLWLKGIKRKETLDYLRERDCFAGAF